VFAALCEYSRVCQVWPGYACCSQFAAQQLYAAFISLQSCICTMYSIERNHPHHHAPVLRHLLFQVPLLCALVQPAVLLLSCRLLLLPPRQSLHHPQLPRQHLQTQMIAAAKQAPGAALRARQHTMQQTAWAARGSRLGTARSLLRQMQGARKGAASQACMHDMCSCKIGVTASSQLHDCCCLGCWC
jgi:hypothetical protein